MDAALDAGDTKVPKADPQGENSSSKDIMQENAGPSSRAVSKESEKSMRLGETKERKTEKRMRDADDRRWNFMHDKETNPERQSSFPSRRKDDSDLTLKKKKKGR